MKAFLWAWIALPVIHWAVVSIIVIALVAIIDAITAKKKESGLKAPLRAKAAGMELQVKRADGTTEPPRTY